jgi:hypothetical protein
MPFNISLDTLENGRINRRVFWPLRYLTITMKRNRVNLLLELNNDEPVLTFQPDVASNMDSTPIPGPKPTSAIDPPEPPVARRLRPRLSKTETGAGLESSQIDEVQFEHRLYRDHALRHLLLVNRPAIVVEDLEARFGLNWSANWLAALDESNRQSVATAPNPSQINIKPEPTRRTENSDTCNSCISLFQHLIATRSKLHFLQSKYVHMEDDYRHLDQIADQLCATQRDVIRLSGEKRKMEAEIARLNNRIQRLQDGRKRRNNQRFNNGNMNAGLRRSNRHRSHTSDVPTTKPLPSENSQDVNPTPANTAQPTSDTTALPTPPACPPSTYSSSGQQERKPETIKKPSIQSRLQRRPKPHRRRSAQANASPTKITIPRDIFRAIPSPIGSVATPNNQGTAAIGSKSIPSVLPIGSAATPNNHGAAAIGGKSIPTALPIKKLIVRGPSEPNNIQPGTLQRRPQHQK